MACQRLKFFHLRRQYLLSKQSACLDFKAYYSERKYSKKPDVNKEKKPHPEKKVAVVLSGCGMLDGTEVHEASAVAVHVSRCGLWPVFYAPFCLQGDVVDHKTGEQAHEERNALVESARIARGKIKCLTELKSCDAGAVVFPGGFGVGKTLSTYAQDCANCNLNRDVIRVLTDFYEAKKPMGFMCISSILAARMFPCVKVTLGMSGDIRKWPHREAIVHAEEMGAVPERRPVSDFVFDKQYLIFSTPAFMYNGTYSEIFDGIGLMIEMMSKIMK